MMYYNYIIMQTSSTIRTQISLTPEIKRAIEAKKRITGESMSEYLRKAALIRMMAEEEEKKELEMLAKSIIGSVSLKNHPNWNTKRKIQRWLKNIRSGWE